MNFFIERMGFETTIWYRLASRSALSQPVPSNKKKTITPSTRLGPWLVMLLSLTNRDELPQQLLLLLVPSRILSNRPAIVSVLRKEPGAGNHVLMYIWQNILLGKMCFGVSGFGGQGVSSLFGTELDFSLTFR